MWQQEITLIEENQRQDGKDKKFENEKCFPKKEGEKVDWNRCKKKIEFSLNVGFC